MKKISVGLFLFLMGASNIFAQTTMSSEMYDLAKIKEGMRNHRAWQPSPTGIRTR